MSHSAPEAAREGRFVLLLGALVAFGPLAIDLYLPALPAIASGLAATPEAVQLSITVFLAGFGLGMLFYGPISDRYGRRTVMLSGIALFALASPFYFIELQHFSPAAYGALFAANAVGIFAANYLNSRLAKSKGAAVMAGVGSASGFAGALLLGLAMSVGDAVPAVIGGLFLVVSMTGLLMARYPQNAGAAAALFGSSQFGFGMWASAAVSYTHDGSGRPMAWVILATTAASLVGYLLFRRASRR